MILENMTSRVLGRYQGRKEQSLKEDRLVNYAYTFILFAADSVAVVPIILFYGLLDNGSTNSAQTVYLTAIYLGILYFPVKIFTYGCFYLLRAAANYHQIVGDMDLVNKKRVKDLNRNIHSHNRHCYPEDLGGCYDYEYEPFHVTQLNSKQTLVDEENRMGEGLPPIIRKKSSTPHYDRLPLHASGSTIMLTAYIESEHNMQDFIENVRKEIPKDKTVAAINEQSFLLPESCRENILLYSPAGPKSDQEMRRVLEMVDLGPYISEVLDYTSSNVSLTFG
jgi:hypothetical protein